ncbi:17870_t:CDS:2 [Funneliformis geosporum]|uniref:803_t:CDS:1 n=1 Tax=Funneliformis geosporum TaxID=1117311 RepID=A0A9W4WYY1_9GLOM|nr:17870_t:CDS:2 [Funneliformis geosporum]CAI2173964.1 803_t:CDS:2 [Funneliformis geosporum]
MNRGALKRTPSLGTMPSFGNLSISSIESPSPTGSNTLNRPAQASQSLYPLCIDLLERLYCVEGFEQYLTKGQNNVSINSSLVGTPTLENSPNSIIRNDPITLLWQTFRLGYPLCALYNALKPQKELKITIETKPKDSVYKFLEACLKELQFKSEQLFTITQLFQDDTNGFVNVIDTVKLVTDKIEEKGLLNLSRRQLLRNSDPMKPTDNRARVVHELLETERKYVQDMEKFARELQIQEIVSADTIHLLFANLNQLVDFQRRFLIGVEANASQPPVDQRFGNLFIQMEDNFAVYEPFCANYQSASELVIQETPNLQRLAKIVEPTYELPSLLIKPIQRICKYPLLLQELLKFSEKGETPYYDEIDQGLKAIKRVADRVNETRRKQENEAIVRDLERRVEDWKGHRIAQFGCLLLEDVFIMSKEDSEREYHVYLFQRILLCCKENNARRLQSKSTPLIKSNIRKQKRSSLQLKGRIFIHNITALLDNSQPPPGSWSLKVFWKGDIEMESFSLKCRHEEQLKQWQSTLQKLLEDSKSQNNISSNSKDESASTTKRTQVSNTQLASLANLDLPLYSRLKSQSLPYGQYPTSSYNGRTRSKTDDGTAPPPYNLNPGSPPLPGIPNNLPQYRSHTNSSMTPTPRNGSTTAPPTMATFPSSVIHNQGESSYFPNSPPPSYPGSPAPSARSSASTSSHSNSMNIWQRKSVEQQQSTNVLADTVAKVMMGNDDEYPVLPMQRSSVGPTPVLQQTSAPSSTRLRSASSSNIQPIQEDQWENMEPLPDTHTNNNITMSNGVQSESHQRHSGSSTLSQTSNTNGINTNVPISNSDLSSPTNGVENSNQFSKYNTLHTTMKIKVNYAEDIFVIVVPKEIEYKELCDRVERKIRLCTTRRDESVPLRIKYQDEDGDHITINSDDDVLMAFEVRLAAGGNFVNLFVS